MSDFIEQQQQARRQQEHHAEDVRNREREKIGFTRHRTWFPGQWFVYNSFAGWQWCKNSGLVTTWRVK